MALTMAAASVAALLTRLAHNHLAVYRANVDHAPKRPMLVTMLPIVGPIVCPIVCKGSWRECGHCKCQACQ
jgi:hypothetical protein